MKCPVCGQSYSRPESVTSCLAWHRACDLAQTQDRIARHRYRAPATQNFVRKVVTK